MPEYFFHLTFELYPSRSWSRTQYTPPPQTDIFSSELPVHRNASWGSFSPASQIPEGFAKSAVSYSDVAQLPVSRDRPAPTRRFSHRTRPSFSDHHESPVPVVKPPKRPENRRTQSLAHKDWRFDAISILSIDMSASNGDELTQSRSKSLKHPAQAQPSGGLATKGKFIPSDLKDTEVGWGVVHLYRDGQETQGLYDEVDGANKDFNQEDCTTLCILAVPSYMTPSDFLGFVGEQTREDVSHFRLIKTSRANKYMVLMKFWDAKQAREWRKGWNGKAFNSMEVMLAMKKTLSLWLISNSPNTAMSSSSSL
jgi:BRCA1-associated protein